jgi:hypothetical protein
MNLGLGNEFLSPFISDKTYTPQVDPRQSRSFSLSVTSHFAISVGMRPKTRISFIENLALNQNK